MGYIYIFIFYVQDLTKGLVTLEENLSYSVGAYSLDANMTKTWQNYREYLSLRFPQKRIRKLCLDAGFTCPNISPTSTGCHFCNNDGFTPEGRIHSDLLQQWNRGCDALRRRHGSIDGFIAYFQAFSNTYAPLPQLRNLYDPLPDCFPECVGVSISTRPDCLNQEIVSYLDDLGQRLFLTVEIGLQNDRDSVLQRINRGHSVACFHKSIEMCAGKNFDVCVHFMIGLPGEGKDVGKRLGALAASLPINSVKLHNLHIMKDTPYERAFKNGTLTPPTESEYLRQAQDFLMELRPDQYVQRIIADAPPGVLVSDNWCSNKQRFLNRLKIIQNEN